MLSINLKRPCHEIFDLWFFHQTVPSGPLIHGLRPFRVWLRNYEDIQQSRLDSGVIDTAVLGTGSKANLLTTVIELF
jgi:hypothetical protein